LIVEIISKILSNNIRDLKLRLLENIYFRNRMKPCRTGMAISINSKIMVFELTNATTAPNERINAKKNIKQTIFNDRIIRLKLFKIFNSKIQLHISSVLASYFKKRTSDLT